MGEEVSHLCAVPPLPNFKNEQALPRAPPQGIGNSIITEDLASQSSDPW